MLVDTGADTTTLPLAFAKQLGISYKPTQREALYGIGDEKICGYSTSLQLKINGTTLKVRTHLLDTQRVLLLGRMDIFDHFTLIFDNEKKELVFKNL